MENESLGASFCYVVIYLLFRSEKTTKYQLMRMARLSAADHQLVAVGPREGEEADQNDDNDKERHQHGDCHDEGIVVGLSKANTLLHQFRCRQLMIGGRRRFAAVFDIIA